MKKIIIYISVIVMIFLLIWVTSYIAADKDVWMHEVIHANSTYEFLDNHESVSFYYNYGDYWEKHYVTREIYCIETPEYCDVFSTDKHYRYESNQYINVLYAGEIYRNRSFIRDDILFREGTGRYGDKILEYNHIGDTIELKTKMTAKRFAKSNLVDDNTKKGDYMEYDYVLDAETLRVISARETLMHRDGTKGKVADITIVYDEQMPKQAQDVLVHVESDGPKRTVTVVRDPDTEDEKSYSIDVLVGDPVVIVHNTDVYHTVYEDRELTIVSSETGDYTSDVTVYLAKGK